ATGGAGNGGVGNGGLAAAGGQGGAGGAGGSNAPNAGTFNMSNSISASFTNGAGIMQSIQNSGIAASVQQSSNVQANLTVR
ncbi:MAG TPA: hypothetical protein VK663_03965, partial [Burkholderiales bacterium]|nr:hypothetical protein [Burkholderiales bacterium]